MSADRFWLAEAIKEARQDIAMDGGSHLHRISVHLYDELEQARIELEDERERVNVQREDIRALRMEVQRLTEEARRSDAGRVEVPELTGSDLRGVLVWSVCGDLVEADTVEQINAWFRSRLSPSPQPATGADSEESHPIGTADSVYFRRELRSLLERMGNADGPWLARYLSRLAAVADASPQPSAEVVPQDRVRYFTCLGPDGYTHFAVHQDGRAWQGDEIDGTIHWRAKETSAMVDGVAVPPDSADVVVVPRELLRQARDNCQATLAETDISDHVKIYRQGLYERLRDALRSSTNHDAQDAGEGR